MRSTSVRISFVVILLVGVLLVVNDVRAIDTSITIDTTSDSNDPAYQACTSAANDCSLRGAISKANADAGNTYTIHIPAGIYTLSLAGSEEDNNATGDLDILATVNLEGEGMDQTIIQAGASASVGIDRVIEISGDATISVEFTDLTVRHGKIGDSKTGAGIRQYNSNSALTLIRVALRDNLGEGYSYGGGLYANGDLEARDCQFTGNVTSGEGGGIYQGGSDYILLDGCLIAENMAEYGGGFANNNLAILINTTISGNTATANGGGISQWNDADLKIHYSTITNNVNTANSNGWAIHDPLVIEIYNSIITAEEGKKACTSLIDAGHHNIGSDTTCDSTILVEDPQLGILKDNGGATLTHALLVGSPAIDAAGDGGNAIACPGMDQRGFPRPFDGDQDQVAVCDIGAFEYVGERIFVPLVKNKSN